MTKLDIDTKFAAHILMYNCDSTILKVIENCGDYVDKIYIAYSQFPWTYNEKARANFKNSSDKAILKQSPYYHKIVIVEGEWDTEEDQRNACLMRAKADGIDYMIVQDADEFYHAGEFKQNLLEIAQNPGYELYLTPWISFWKSLDYILVDENSKEILGYPQFAVNCNSNAVFSDKRSVSTDKVYKLKGLCYHLSYVLTDEQVWEKINTWGHTAEFDLKKWYKEKWVKWNLSMEDIHPILPRAWKRVIQFEGELPEVLRVNKSDFPVGSEYKERNSIMVILKKIVRRLLYYFRILIHKCSSLAKNGLFSIVTFFRYLKKSFTWKGKLKSLVKKSGAVRLHLGCGNKRFEDMLNCEYRVTDAADVVMDCGKLNKFKDDSCSIIFSHAFFEHLYRNQHKPLMEACHKKLNKDGVLLFIGIPDFEEIARSYLKGAEHNGELFDLFNVYRYTHGHPEMANEYWLEQLHKALFDKVYIATLLKEANFKTFKVFNYAYPGEDISLNLGFIALKRDGDIDLHKMLEPFSEYISSAKEIAIHTFE